MYIYIYIYILLGRSVDTSSEYFLPCSISSSPFMPYPVQLD